MKALAEAAVDAALGAGASYADARAVRLRRQHVVTKNLQVDDLSDSESEGIGVRVLVDGAWGFAGEGRLDETGAREAALRAASFAKAAPGRHETSLVPLDSVSGDYRTPLERDPFDVPLSEKVDLCLRAEEGMRVPQVKVTLAMVRAQREHKVLVSSDGVAIEQELVECGGGIDAMRPRTAARRSGATRASTAGSSGQGGWEFVEGLALAQEAPRVAEQVVALLSADECPAGGRRSSSRPSRRSCRCTSRSATRPSSTASTARRRPTRERASLARRPRHASVRLAKMNIVSDATTPLGLGTFAFDDEGVPAQREAIVEEGVLRGFLTSRETAARIGAGSGGSMRADGWSRMPLVRMTNLHLEPGEGSFEELLADVDDGLYLETNKSWSIDDKRLNFQFGTQIAWEIKKGKLGRMLRDATYTGVTPVFWGKLDAVAGPDEWRLFGLTNCGKGQPGQEAHVSHGAAPARFRDVEVGVSG